MKKILSIFGLSILTITHLFAQNKGSLELTLGPTFPLGEFHSAIAGDPGSAITRPGALAEIAWSLPVTHTNFGITALLRARQNTANAKADVQNFKDISPDDQYTMAKAHWTIGAAMVGGYYHRSITSKLEWQGRLLVGAAIVHLPATDVTGSYNSLTVITGKEQKVNTTTFSAMAGAGLAYHLASRWDLLARLDYWYLKPAYDIKTVVTPFFTAYYPNGNSYTVAENTKFTRNMSSLDLTLGVSYRL